MAPLQDIIVAVIVTRNRLEKLKKAIDSILRQDVSGVVVVDNQSTDDTVQWLHSLNSDKLTIITPENNLGGAGGFALGFRKAAAIYDPEWLLCFDDDAYPSDGLIAHFRSMDFPADTGIVAAAVFAPDQTITEMNRPLFLAPTSIFAIPHYLTGGRSSYVVSDNAYKAGNSLEIQASSFVGCFVKREVIAAIGVPRQELFIYADDIIYTYQAFKAGFKNIFCSDLIFYHDCQLENKKEVYPLWKVYFLLRNQIEMHRIFNNRNFWLPAIMRFMYRLMRLVFYRHKRRYCKVICHAFYDGLTGKFNSTPWVYLEKLKEH